MTASPRTITLLWEGDIHTYEPIGAAGRLGISDLERITGWELRAEGLCNGAACIPVRERATLEPVSGVVDLAGVAELLDRPIVVDEDSSTVAVGVARSARRDALVSRRAPSFELPALDGTLWSFDDLRGRCTVLVTFSSWCGCRYDLPGWQGLADELGPEGLSVIAVAFDQDAAAVVPFTDGITIPVLLDAAHLLSELYAISNVPTIVWIDESGRIVRPNIPAFGTDLFSDFHGVPAGPHLDAIREWVRGGGVPEPVGAGTAVADLSADEQAARLWFRIGAHLHRLDEDRSAAAAFERGSRLAPLDFTVVRASMPLTGRDPFGEEFLALYGEWEAAGRPFHGLSPDLEPS